MPAHQVIRDQNIDRRKLASLLDNLYPQSCRQSSTVVNVQVCVPRYSLRFPITDCLKWRLHHWIITAPDPIPEVGGLPR